MNHLNILRRMLAKNRDPKGDNTVRWENDTNKMENSWYQPADNGKRRHDNGKKGTHQWETPESREMYSECKELLEKLTIPDC